MKRLSLSILGVALLLAAPQPAVAQCSNQIMVFLDISGSMDPLGRTPNSPFLQSLEALEIILEDEGFIGLNDEIRVVLFGTVLHDVRTARGPREARAMLDELKRNELRSDDTDFEEIFRHIQQLPPPEERLDRQLLIIASDFAHDPARSPKGAPQSENIRDWENRVLALGEDVLAPYRVEVEGRPNKRGVLLLNAPTDNDRFPVQTKVLGDLTTLLNAEQNVHAIGGATTPERVARAIRKQLFYPLELSVERRIDDPGSFHVTASNTNCAPLQIESLRFGCIEEENGREELAADRITIGWPSRLGGVSDADRELTRPVPLSMLACPKGVHEYDVRLITREGAEGATRARRANTLRYEGVVALAEDPLVGAEMLRVFLNMQGEVYEQAEYEIELRRPPAERIASGRFLATRDLIDEDAATYEFMFPFSGEKAGLIGNAVDVRIREPRPIGDPLEFPGSGDPLAVERDTAARLNVYLRVAWVLVLALPFLTVVIRYFSEGGNLRGPVFRASTFFLHLVPAIPLVVTTPAYPFAAGVWTFETLELAKTGAIALSVAFAFLVLARSLLGAMISWGIRTSRYKEPKGFERLVKSGTWVLVGALVLVAVISVGLVSLRPADYPEIRDARNVQLTGI